MGLLLCRLAGAKVFETPFYRVDHLRQSIDCITLLLMRLLNTSILCVCDFIRVYITLIMLCFCGDHMVGKFFIKNNVTTTLSCSTSRTLGVSVQMTHVIFID